MWQMMFWWIEITACILKNYSTAHRGITSPDSAHADAFADASMGSIRKPCTVHWHTIWLSLGGDAPITLRSAPLLIIQKQSRKTLPKLA